MSRQLTPPEGYEAHVSRVSRRPAVRLSPASSEVASRTRPRLVWALSIPPLSHHTETIGAYRVRHTHHSEARCTAPESSLSRRSIAPAGRRAPSPQVHSPRVIDPPPHREAA